MMLGWYSYNTGLMGALLCMCIIFWFYRAFFAVTVLMKIKTFVAIENTVRLKKYVYLSSINICPLSVIYLSIYHLSAYLSTYLWSGYLSACIKLLDLWSPSGERGVTDLGIGIGDESGGDFSQRGESNSPSFCSVWITVWASVALTSRVESPWWIFSVIPIILELIVKGESIA